MHIGLTPLRLWNWLYGWIHVCDFKVKVDNSCNRTDLSLNLGYGSWFEKGALNIFCSGVLILGECIYACPFYPRFC